MRPFILLALALMVLSAPAPAAAETYTTDWGLEASIYYEHTNYSFDELNRSIEDRRLHAISQNHSSVSSSEFEPAFEPDLRLGVRYLRFHLGFMYSSAFEQEGKVTYAPNAYYSLKLRNREVGVYGGYFHPLGRYVDIGLQAGAGFGFVMGNIYSDVDIPGGIVTGEVHPVDGNYVPWRAEMRMRWHVRYNIALDIGGGYHSSYDENPTANYTGLGGGDNYVPDHEGQAIGFDWSGWYVGVGVTLKNPYED